MTASASEVEKSNESFRRPDLVLARRSGGKCFQSPRFFSAGQGGWLWVNRFPRDDRHWLLDARYSEARQRFEGWICRCSSRNHEQTFHWDRQWRIGTRWIINLQLPGSG